MGEKEEEKTVEVYECTHTNWQHEEIMMLNRIISNEIQQSL